MIFVFIDFPVGKETLSRLILDNEFESDIFKVNFVFVLLFLLLWSYGVSSKDLAKIRKMPHLMGEHIQAIKQGHLRC